MASVSQVVWVAQWYPHRGEPLAGDFIQRHARAVALFLPVHLFACFPAAAGREEVVASDNLTEHLIYYKPITTGWRKLDKVLYWQQWSRLLKRALSKYFRQQGKPSLLHCHITLNAGWLGLWAKKKWGIPYLITEHWSGYMPGAIEGYAAYNRWSKRLFHRIVHHAAGITTVSEALANAIKNIDSQAACTRVPNVVDEVLFHPKQRGPNKIAFEVLHVSTFSPQKNMLGMLAGFDALVKALPSVRFHIVGPAAIFRQRFPQQSISGHYQLHDEMPQPQLASLMQQCDVCVLFSHYETFGCVVAEANAAGLPVVVSDIPVLREIVQYGENGLLVPPDNPGKLCDALLEIAGGAKWFSPASVSQKTRQLYSFQAVGKQFVALYEKLNFRQV